MGIPDSGIAAGCISIREAVRALHSGQDFGLSYKDYLAAAGRSLRLGVSSL